MTESNITIVEAERLNKTQLVVSFSDGTAATYDVNDLLALAPNRMPSPGEEPGT